MRENKAQGLFENHNSSLYIRTIKQYIIMKRLSFFMGMLLFVSMGMFASPRSVSEAEALAAEFLQQHPALSSPSGASRVASADALTLAHTHLQSDATTPAVYVFSRANEGFVLVSADDKSRSILGYADEGVFRTDDLPANVRFWLDMYAHEIERASKSVASGTVSSRSEYATTYTAVSPLCGATWNQGAPYNNLCPTKNGERCVTGCVATAAAQVMYANQWPTKGTSSHSYTWNGQTLSADFSKTTYQWSNMLADYSGSSTTTQQTAVATLMYHCGVACEMEYGTNSEGGSGAITSLMAQALNTYFGYDAGIITLPKDYMDADVMLDKMAADLQAGHTILMDGHTVNNEGHAFVCDGIQSNGYLHINWGWGGYCDGYFALSALEPADQGIGGASSGLAFTEYVSAYTNIKPDEGGKPTLTVTADNITWTSNAQLAKTEPIYFQIDRFSNAGTNTMDGYYGFAIYKDGNVVASPVSNYVGGALPAGNYFIYSQSTSVIVGDLPDGAYELSVGISQDETYWPFYVAGVGEKRFPFVIQNGYVYQGTEEPTDTAGLTIRVRIGEDCTMDVSNGVWLWWWDGTNSACAATTYADGWYTATLQPETTPIGCLVVNRDVIVDGWGDASTQSLDYQSITEDICLQVGAVADGEKYASLTAVDCESGIEEEITPSFDFTRLEVEDWTSAGYANNLDIHIVTEDYSYTANGFFGTDLYLIAIAKSMTSIVGTYTLNHSSNFGYIVSGVVRYGKGTKKEISLSSGCVTISLDANGDYLISYELYDEEGTLYVEEGRTISVAKTNSYTYNAATGNWELYALQNECVTAALSASGIKSLTENLMHTNVTTMSYFAEGVVDYMVNDSAQMVQYGTGRFYISDDGTRNNEYYLYNTKWLGNSKFTAENAGLLHLGDTVIAFGPVQNYKGTTPEMQKGYVYEHHPYVEPQYSAPENLTATTVNGYDYTFTWSGGKKPAPVYMLEVLCEGYTYHSSTLSETSQAVTLAIEGAYTWRVSACDSAENIVATTEAMDSVIATNVPDYNAKNLQIAVSDSTMTATWESLANVFGIYIYDVQGNIVLRDLIDQKSYTWTGSAGTYYFYVRPVNDEWTFYIGTEWTYQQFTFYAEDPALYTPYDLQASPSYGKIYLTWSARKGNRFAVNLHWTDTSGEREYTTTADTTFLELIANGLSNTTISWKVATIDSEGNFLSEYVQGEDFIQPDNPYQLQNLQATSSDGYNYMFTWGYAALKAPQYRVKIYTESDKNYRYQDVTDTTCTIRFTEEGTYYWKVNAYDENNNALGFARGDYFTVTIPQISSYTLTTTVPEDCTMDFSKGMWYFWWNDEYGLTGSVQAMLNNEGKYVATIEAPCEYIGCLVATADPLTTSWDSLQQTYDSPTLYGDACLTIGIHDWGKYWYLDARPCDEDLTPFVPENLQVQTGVGTADFTWTAKEYEQFEVLLNQVESPEVLSRYTTSYPNLGLMFNANAIGKWQWRVRALSNNNAPLTAFVEGPAFEIKENPYLPYNLKATTQDSATYYLTWEADVQAPQYYLEVGNGFEAYVTNQPVEVRFEQEGYYAWRVIPCDSAGNSLGFVYGEDIYVPAHAVPDYSVSDLQVQTVVTTTTATWNSTWDNFAVWLYDRSTWERIDEFTTGNTYAQWENLAAGDYQVNVISLDKSDAYVWETETIVQFTVEETPAPTPYYTITLLAGAGGTVNSSINNTYAAGTTLNLVATPDNGYRFLQWSDGNLQAERSIVLMQNTVLTATFELIPTVVEYTLTVNTAVGGSTNLTGTMTYEEDAQVSLVATPDAGYTFTKWAFEDKTESTDNPLFLTMTEDMTVTPVFTKKTPEPTYTLTVDTVGNGTVTCDPQADTYQRGTIVTLTAKPAEGWHFVQWSDGDKGTTHRIVITQDMVITATFEEDIPEPTYYTLTVNKEGQGTVTIAPKQDKYEADATVTLEAVPAEGWQFKQWEDGTTNTTRTLTMSADKTVTATFVEDIPEPTYYTLTVNKEGQGTVTVKPQQDKYQAGTTVKLEAVPAEGWQFKQWEDGTTNVSRVVTMTEDKVVTATFEEIPVYAVTDLSITVTTSSATATWKSEAPLFEVIITNNKGEEQAADTIAEKTYLFKGKAGKKYTISIRPMDSDRKTYLENAVTKDFTLERLYSVFISAGTGGSVNDEVNGDEYVYGTKLTIIATPKEGYRFKKWSDGDTASTREITVTEDIALEATFQRIPSYTVTIYEVRGGTTNPAPNTYTLLENESMSITAIPDDGFVFTRWNINGEEETANPFVITAIATDYNIEPTFTNEEMGTEQTTLQPVAEKFIQNGLLYIRRGETIYDAQGHITSSK